MSTRDLHGTFIIMNRPSQRGVVNFALNLKIAVV